MKDSVKLDVARLIAGCSVEDPLYPSEIRSAGRTYCESGGQRFRELRSEAGGFMLAMYDPKRKIYRISLPLKRYCQRYVREHQN